MSQVEEEKKRKRLRGINYDENLINFLAYLINEFFVVFVDRVFFEKIKSGSE